MTDIQTRLGFPKNLRTARGAIPNAIMKVVESMASGTPLIYTWLKSEVDPRAEIYTTELTWIGTVSLLVHDATELHERLKQGTNFTVSFVGRKKGTRSRRGFVPYILWTEDRGEIVERQEKILEKA